MPDFGLAYALGAWLLLALLTAPALGRWLKHAREAAGDFRSLNSHRNQREALAGKSPRAIP